MRVLIRSSAGIVVIAILLGGLWLMPAQAVPITFTFTGTGSGQIGGTSFANAAFTVMIPGGDTNIPGGDTNRPLTRSISDLSGTITITGLGVSSFSIPLFVFVNNDNQSVGFGDSTIDYMVLQKSEIGLKTYGLDSSFGRINDPSPFFTLFKSVPTSNGLLSFSAMRDATFTATAVPLPAPLLLLGSGLLGLAGLRRFRKG